MMTKIDHIGIAVRNLDQSLSRWKDVFRLKVRTIEEIRERGVRLAQLDLEEEPSIELISALGDESPIKKFIEDRGEGIHHICFEVKDVRAVIEVLRRIGIQFVSADPQKGAEGSLIAFIHPGSFNGVLIELKEKRKIP